MLRNPKPILVNTWRGLNSFTDREDLDEQSWFAANNVLVNSKGHAEVLRSPKAFGGALELESSEIDSSTSSETGEIVSMAEYKRAAGHALIIDRGETSFYLLEAGGDPTTLRTDQAGDPWTSLTVNDRLHRIDGNEFIQFLTNLTSQYRNGIDGPAAAPTIAYEAESSESSPVSESSDTTISVSLQGSYSYMNSTTGHVSPPSPLSNVLGPSAGDNAVSFTVVASSQPGVDKIVFFLTVDGGNIPYLVIDCDDGDTHLENNATTTYTFNLSDIDRDTLTPEPIYNYPPPVTATFMFEWKDRIFLIVDGQLQYSGFESCYIGQPAESWPLLNQLNLPNKSDRAVGGISTQLGALVFGKDDSYLLSGYPSDKTSSPNNSIAVTEHIEPMNWRLGITYPQTAVNTPYGVIWVDQTKRVRNWNLQGYPIEIAQALRTELDNMTGTLSAKWFQHGKNGGYYVLTDGTTTLFIMLYLSPETGQLQFGYGKTDTAMTQIQNCTFGTTEKMFFATDDQVYEILNPSQEGDGWPTGTEIYFQVMVGNQLNFSTFHSLILEGYFNEMVATVARPDPQEDGTLIIQDEEPIFLEDEIESAGAQYGLVDRYGRRHVLSFRFGIDDRKYRSVDSTAIVLKPEKRII